MSKKNVIGRWAHVDLPSLDIFNVQAKVDTGAYRSALHCDFMEEFDKDGEIYLKIQTTDLSGKPIGDHANVVKQIGKVRVKSSNGQSQLRPIIKIPVTIDSHTQLVEFTLSNRQDMKFPILLGRKFLNGKFLVDVSLEDPEI